MSAKIVVLISGNGSNLQALIDACAAGQLDVDSTGSRQAQIALVVSNRRHAYGLQRAQNANIPTLYFPTKGYPSREAYDAALADAICERVQPDLIVLAGWMRILTPTFIDQFPQKIINLHPALPGQFAGTHAIERAFAAYQRGDIDHSGCMVHYVIPKVDAGPVIAQAIVPIHPNDTLDQFATRMHATEHRLLVLAVYIALHNR